MQILLRLFLFLPVCASSVAVVAEPSRVHERMVEWTIESRKAYADPFNDVDVDVVFAKDGQSWRVPTFWRGEDKWTVRFAPPAPGTYSYRLESTDKANPDLNGRKGKVQVTAYQGASNLLKRGAIKVSANKRYFEHADGTPFYWLADTWWSGLSTRLSWEDFKKLTADRKNKGFTAVQTVAGLIPGEEKCPTDPGCRNEGGSAWNADVTQVNPGYFDYADRRIQHLIDMDIAPVIVGAWSSFVPEIGVAKLKKHWRYVIARYGAYPVIWVVGGEVFDPPKELALELRLDAERMKYLGGWSEVARFIRAVDPYHHPLSVHQSSQEYAPLQEESLTDFDLFHPSHFSWTSIAVEVMQLNMHYAQTHRIRPLVVGEVGYEMLANTHLEDFQRIAFWLAMLNGAAGHSYGANGTWESYSGDKPLHRWKWSFMTWEEGMNLPGSYHIGLGAKLLRQYPWWKFEPHPEWIAPRGTTFLEPRERRDRIDLGASIGEFIPTSTGIDFPRGEWKARNGNYLLPYAAGIPGQVRVVYLPYFWLHSILPMTQALTVFALEQGVRYHAYYWEPRSGLKIDLGAIERPSPGASLFEDKLANAASGYETRSGEKLRIVDGIKESNLVVAIDARADADAGLILRYQDVGNYVAAVYSATDKAIYLLERKAGVLGEPLGRTAAESVGSAFRLTAEVRDGMGIVSLAGTGKTITTPIVTITNTAAGRAGFLASSADGRGNLASFEIRQSPQLVADAQLERTLYDASGGLRGEMKGPGLEGSIGGGVSWDTYGKNKHLLLDAYRPERLPTTGDWVLVLERANPK